MNDRRKSKLKRKDRYALAGWLLFILCAVFYIASSLKNHDPLAIIGSVLFLIACLVFMVPIIRPDKETVHKTEHLDE
ncbi:MAG: hypothetical protein QNJ61_07270 [Desulfobacterales bacterium]|nr:hypothetical protein [Desulfobacterales bacterium]